MKKLSDTELLNLIKEARGISIYLGRNTEGGDYWSVVGGEVNAGGYSTLNEALQKWGETEIWAKEEGK